MYSKFRIRHVLNAFTMMVCCFPLRTAHLPAAESLLPDLIATSDVLGPRMPMRDGVFDLTSMPGHSLYRFSAAIPNIGVGAFEVRETTHPDNTQDVFQRIYDTEGEITERAVGTFTDVDPAFGHLFLEGLAQYNLRQVLPDEGVGPIVSSHEKTSFGLVDSGFYDGTLPGSPQQKVYLSANSAILGVSVGWFDWYGRNLPGQWVDATGLPDGTYWLEVVIDPHDLVLELDNSNNVARILVDLEIPGTVAGDYNHDGVVNAGDYSVWRDELGRTDPAIAADGNLNGVVDQEDYHVWRNNFGLTDGPVAAAGQSVPEPEIMPLLGIALVCLCYGRLGRTKIGDDDARRIGRSLAIGS